MSAVAKCIAKVQAQLAKEGISKDRRNQQQNYSFRGIDDVYNALSGLLADAGLVIVPSYETREIAEREAKSGGVLFSVVVKGMYTLIAAEDGSELRAGPFWGEAMDSADKATNKAMSAAYKYMAMQVFAIPTEGDNDADGSTHTVTAIQRTKITPTAGVFEQLDIERQRLVEYHAGMITDAYNRKEISLAYEIYVDANKNDLTTEEQVALRSKLLAPVKTALQNEKKRIEEASLRAMGKGVGANGVLQP